MNCNICYEENCKFTIYEKLKKYQYDFCKNDFKCFINICDDCLLKYVEDEDIDNLKIKNCMFCRSETFKLFGIFQKNFNLIID